MSVDTSTGQHFPANSMMFEFDAEVISVFENMSRRSIPGYEHAYKMIGHFASRYPWPETGAEVWDFGTTIGKALSTIRDAIHLAPYINYHGLDVSIASVDKTQDALPWSKVHLHDLRDGLFPENYAPVFPAHMMVFGYTLQFIQDVAIRRDLIKQAYAALAEGGMLFVMEKYTLLDPTINRVAQDAYIQFRRDNGYTLDEIKAKGKALENSMWPSSPEFMEASMRDAGFTNINVLYRDLNFGGFVAIK
jgi:tRNA (cmo5U34)-methyltransferase